MVLYRIFISIYFFSIRIAAFFSPKAKSWVQGRSDILPYLRKQQIAKDVVWFHCASLGEFEQGRSLMEQMKSDFPDTKILLTFFSPSGYEACKDYVGADYICYLPKDRPKAIRLFLAQVKPKMVVFVKYEYWFLLLKGLIGRSIPVYFVSVVVKEDHFLTKWYAYHFRKILKNVTHFYTQDEFSKEQFEGMGIHRVTVVGDTRVDRVVALSQNAKSFPFVKKWVGSSPVFICGSTWKEDEKLLIPVFDKLVNSGWKIIIAPHEVHDSNIRRLRKILPENILLKSVQVADSKRVLDDFENINILLVDTIGQLNSLYQYGAVAYIGGGFTKSGIHNTLEPATFGLALIFGPNYEKFSEAVFFAKNGALVVSSDSKELILENLRDKKWLNETGRTNLLYVKINEGATMKILGDLYKYL